VTNAPLRGCPLCHTPIADVDIGLRDYRWLGEALPGRVAPTDIDFLLERRGKFLIHEYKPKGMPVNKGQRIALTRLVRKGFDVWLVQGDGPVKVEDLGANGRAKRTDIMELGDLAGDVGRWFEEASKLEGER
jgi:hypothetical protein